MGVASNVSFAAKVVGQVGREEESGQQKRTWESRLKNECRGDCYRCCLHQSRRGMGRIGTSLSECVSHLQVGQELWSPRSQEGCGDDMRH